MIKPDRLQKGGTAAIVNLPAGTPGKPWAIHKLTIARERPETDRKTLTLLEAATA